MDSCKKFYTHHLYKELKHNIIPPRSHTQYTFNSRNDIFPVEDYIKKEEMIQQIFLNSPFCQTLKF